jgi:hypothetical protein
MMTHCSGLGQDVSYDPTTLAAEALLAGGGTPAEIPFDVAPDTSVYTPAVYTGGAVPAGYILTSQGQVVPDTSGQPYVSTNPALDAQNQAITNKLAESASVSDALAKMNSANALLAALTKAGTNAAQIAVAQSNAKAAQAAYAKMVAAVAGTACSSTIVTGVCNSTLLIGGLVIGALVMAFGMKAR